MSKHKYDYGFRATAVEKCLDSDRSLRFIARELGIAESSLRRWKWEYQEALRRTHLEELSMELQRRNRSTSIKLSYSRVDDEEDYQMKCDCFGAFLSPRLDIRRLPTMGAYKIEFFGGMSQAGQLLGSIATRIPRSGLASGFLASYRRREYVSHDGSVALFIGSELTKDIDDVRAFCNTLLDEWQSGLAACEGEPDAITDRPDCKPDIEVRVRENRTRG